MSKIDEIYDFSYCLTREEWVVKAAALGHDKLDAGTFAILWTTQSEDLLCKIFLQLDLQGVALMASVSKTFRRAAMSDDVWIQLLTRHFPFAKKQAERSRPAIFITWVEYFRHRYTQQRQLARDFPRHVRSSRILPQDATSSPRSDTLLTFVKFLPI